MVLPAAHRCSGLRAPRGRRKPRHQARKHAARREPTAAHKNMRLWLLQGGGSGCAQRSLPACRAICKTATTQQLAMHKGVHMLCLNICHSMAAAREVPVRAWLPSGHPRVPRAGGDHDNQGQDVRWQDCRHLVVWRHALRYAGGRVPLRAARGQA